MKLITKKNIIPIICISYTVLSISLTIYEIIVNGKMNPAQLNIFLFLILSILGVVILSQHYRFERFSPLTMIIMQYAIAITVILISLKIASFFVDIHPDGYRDLTLSFSIPYIIGAIIYYIALRLEVNKQNKLLENIKKKRKQSI
ncbi:MAG: hypothetical protein MSA90_11500 [Faecalicatena sp.]|uniref:DUF6608 family protein n=1 Tax=Faecalicatena sp. TaxID=2005360 RepID=UPI0025892CC5|nr:DUF6608 family protein [Faecalicatena sp.]MCI6466077.1 hypothetical protein [Faecalicatena sp.]MDY5621107.1 DUF6608 family protein [Lachnospiraceae bacterium]